MSDLPSVEDATARNSSFSRSLPGLQLFIDSTSLGTFKECPRKYLYSVIYGFQPAQQSIHLTFGLLVHSALERYDHMRSRGEGHEPAVREVVKWALAETWDSALGRPRPMDSRGKNRLGLLRTLVWYLDRFGENDSCETIQLANGKPAVEVSFSFELGYTALSTGEALWACGHLDRIVRLGADNYVLDRKTTEHTIDSFWFNRFTPDNQFSMYCLAGQVALATPTKGLIVDGMQVAASFSRFERALVPRPPAVVDEFSAGLAWWARQMESCALQQHWPMNEKSCGLYGGCGFRDICGRPPGARGPWLKAGFKTRVWDPLVRRGDI